MHRIFSVSGSNKQKPAIDLLSRAQIRDWKSWEAWGKYSQKKKKNGTEKRKGEEEGEEMEEVVHAAKLTPTSINQRVRES